MSWGYDDGFGPRGQVYLGNFWRRLTKHSLGSWSNVMDWFIDVDFFQEPKSQMERFLSFFFPPLSSSHHSSSSAQSSRQWPDFESSENPKLFGFQLDDPRFSSHGIKIPNCGLAIMIPRTIPLYIWDADQVNVRKLSIYTIDLKILASTLMLLL